MKGLCDMARVLVVDDSNIYRFSMSEILENTGHIIIGEAKNGQEAVESYKELHPDVVTMDVTMPEKDGFEALKEILEFDAGAKVIMVSATVDQSILSEALIQGAYDILVKPFDPEQVLLTLNGLTF